MQKIMLSMAMFFQPRGAVGGGGAGEMQVVGMCGCGGMIQLARDPELEPVRSEISCSSAVVQGCTVGLGPMPITATFREFEVCSCSLYPAATLQLVFRGCEWSYGASKYASSVLDLRIDNSM